MILARIVCVLIGYCFGMILVGYILGKLSNVDITKQGSGNVGTTNAMRVLGAKMGLITLLFDVSKGWMAAGMAWFDYHVMYPDDIKLLMVYAAFGAVLGHDFPVYMGFKGGKGVATGIAFFSVLAPAGIPLAVGVFLLTVFVSRYVSLASILGTMVCVVELCVFARLGWVSFQGSQLAEVTVLTMVVAGIVIIKHRSNINRLITGQENVFALHSKNER